MKVILTIYLLLLSVQCIDGFFIKSARMHSKTDLAMALKYDKSKFVKTELSKPMGAVFEEVMQNQAAGIYIQSLSDDGNAKKVGLKPGMMLIDANGIDMRSKDFDGAMDILVDAESPLSLTFADMNDVFKGKAELSLIDMNNGNQLKIECLKGQVLRDVLLDAKIDVYSMKGKMTNCGGGGTCGTCVVGVDVPDDDGWEPRPGFESKRLKSWPANCRLSCNMIVEGDATITIKPDKDGDAGSV